MNFYKNHFGMIISSVVAICISLIMATSAIFVDKLTFTLPLLIKNWGTAFLVISLTGMAFPLTDWSFALCRKMGLRPETLPHVLVENFVATLFFLVLAGMLEYVGQGLLAAAFAGSLAGFLVWNLHPAKVFMGDTGSLFIGGLLCALAFGINQPFLLVPVGVVYIAENLSVLLQVGYFKLTHGKRLFKMAPLHHHFEMCGWSEAKIVTVFSLVTLLGCIGAALLVIYA